MYCLTPGFDCITKLDEFKAIKYLYSEKIIEQPMLAIKKEIALNAFQSGYNCAQSVLRASALELDLNLDQAMQMASGFGGGMGKLQLTCGAFTGAVMVIGMQLSQQLEDPEERKSRIAELIHSFHQKFLEKRGAIDCKSLLNVDLNSPEGKKKYELQSLNETICQHCVAEAVAIVHVLLHPDENVANHKKSGANR